MKERPILFSDPMVRAILDGRKTQTRRLLKPMPPSPEDVRAKGGVGPSFIASDRERDMWRPCGSVWAVRDACGAEQWRCPYGAAGDRLWVRETWNRDGGAISYRADGDWIADYLGATTEPSHVPKWRPSIFLKREDSRIALEVTSVRVERLADISEADANAEGVDAMDGVIDEVALCHRAKEMGETPTDARVWFSVLWDSINGERAAWASNPWVWAVEFKMVQP